jgi:hypothetical protein
MLIRSPCRKGDLNIRAEALSEMQTGRVIEVWRNAVYASQKNLYNRYSSRLHEWCSEMITRACTTSEQLLFMLNLLYVGGEPSISPALVTGQYVHIVQNGMG